MGTGNITLYWYALCCVFTVFVLIVTGAIVGYSRWKRRQARKRREKKRD